MATALRELMAVIRLLVPPLDGEAGIGGLFHLGLTPDVIRLRAHTGARMFPRLANRTIVEDTP